MDSTVAAVRTTGIYCRPDCSARPHAHNVSDYLLPAAAEAAGYRACLRCRPYRLDAPLGAIGAELVCRAVQLVVDGALDDSTEAELAARLGVSSRHLRRQFHEHLGVTPDQLARSRRVHFARRLLDDTDLTVGEIAFAAGFGSVRQFNRACRDTFRATPLELRARRRRTDRLVADGGLDIRLEVQGSLDWTAMCSWFAARAAAGVEAVEFGGDHGPTYRRTIEVSGHPAAMELRALRQRAGSGKDSRDTHDDRPTALVLRVHLPDWAGLIHIARRARRLAALDLDMAAATSVLRDDPVLGPSVRARPGLRPPGAWNPFEVGVRAILGQQVSVSAATKAATALVGTHGSEVPGLAPMGLTRLFPSATTLADADLGGIGITAARQATVRRFAAAVAEGTLLLDRSVSLDELLDRLQGIDGIGPWTAQYIALRLGEPDAFPSGDTALLTGWATLSDGPRPTPRELTSVAEGWQPHRSVAAMHLWQASAGARSAHRR